MGEGGLDLARSKSIAVRLVYFDNHVPHVQHAAGCRRHAWEHVLDHILAFAVVPRAQADARHPLGRGLWLLAPFVVKKAPFAKVL